jgi:hypothetical protein
MHCCQDAGSCPDSAGSITSTTRRSALRQTARLTWAAAAALWLVKHRQELKRRGYAGTWKQVEAVRQALYQSADKSSFAEWKKYYGNGILRAMDALDTPVPDIDDSLKAPSAESSWGGVLEALGLFLKRRRAAMPVGASLEQSIALEVEGLLMNHPDREDILTDASALEESQILEHLASRVAGMPEASEQLRRLFG